MLCWLNQGMKAGGVSSEAHRVLSSLLWLQNPLYDFRPTAACMFSRNAVFPTRQGNLETGCLPRAPGTAAAVLWRGMRAA